MTSSHSSPVVWELFSGTGDISLKIRSLSGGKVRIARVDWSLAVEAESHADLSTRTFYGLVEELGMPSFIWASPDCTTYSIAQHGIHRGPGGVPRDDLARFNDKMNANLWNNILSPARDLKIPFLVENPKGMYQNMWFLPEWVKKKLIWYYDYGGDTAKPTYFFTYDQSLLDWFDAPHIWKRNAQSLPIDRKRGYLERGRIPVRLVERIAFLAIAKSLPQNELPIEPHTGI